MTGFVHDMWCDADALERQADAQQISIPLRNAQNDEQAFVLQSDGVENVRIDDREQIGWYTINTIDVDHAQKVVTINGNIPITVVISGRSNMIVSAVFEL